MGRTYSEQLSQKSSTLTVSDVVTLKYDNIHEQLFMSALKKYSEAARINWDSYSYIEIKGKKFDSPSTVCIISSYAPFTRKVVDLSPYWGDYKFNSHSIGLLTDDEMTTETLEILDKNFAKGTARLHSRLTGKVVTVDMKSIPVGMKTSTSDIDLENSFSYKMENNIYGV